MLMSSSKEVASVDDATKTVIANLEGEATITVYLASDTSVFKEIKVTVLPKDDNPGEDNPGEDNPGEDNPGSETQITGIEIICDKDVIYLDDVVKLDLIFLIKELHKQKFYLKLQIKKLLGNH